MSAETITSASPASAAPVQGASPIPKLEARGERDFDKQLTEQGGAEKVETVTPVETTTPVVTTTPAVTPTTTPASTDDRAALIRAAVEGTLAGINKPAQQGRQPEKELTDAEFNSKYGIPTIDAGIMQRLLDADPAKGALVLQNLLMQAVRSGALISKDLYTSDITKLRGEFEPHVKSWQDYQNERTENKAQEMFYTDHPDLKDEKELVMELKDALIAKIQSGQRKPFTSQKEANKAVADAARLLVARMNKPGTAAQGGAAPAAIQPSTRQMSAASSAGRSGTGHATVKSAVEEVFGADAR